jgi:hypothetical protein
MNRRRGLATLADVMMPAAFSWLPAFDVDGDDQGGGGSGTDGAADADSGGGGKGDQDGGDAGPKMGPNGFPLNTPWRQMTPEQQVSYHLYQSRKHEDALKAERARNADLAAKAQQFDALSEASKSELERERDAAKAEAEALRQAALEAKRSFGTQLVETKLAAAAPAKGMDPAALKTLAGDLTRFLSDDGVNTEAVDTFLSALPDKPVEQPRHGRGDLGAGNRGTAKTSGLQAGADLWEQRHPKRKTSA